MFIFFFSIFFCFGGGTIRSENKCSSRRNRNIMLKIWYKFYNMILAEHIQLNLYSMPSTKSQRSNLKSLTRIKIRSSLLLKSSVAFQSFTHQQSQRNLLYQIMLLYTEREESLWMINLPDFCCYTNLVHYWYDNGQQWEIWCQG